MPYTKQTWADNDPSKPVSAARMGVIETGIETATTVAEGAATQASTALSSATSAAEDAADALAAASTGQPPAKAKYVADTETITSTTYVKGTVADEVTGLVTSNNHGILEIGFRAFWRQSTMTAFARAAIFVDGVQLQIIRGYNPLTLGIQAGCQPGGSTSGNDMPLITFPLGLCSFNTSGSIGSVTIPAAGVPVPMAVQWGSGHSGPVWCDDNSMSNIRATYDNAAGGAYQTPGGVCLVPVQAGTHTVDIRYRVDAGGSCTIKERRLWARVMPHST